MNNENQSYSTNMISHLSRLSDGIFALSMALSLLIFDFPDSTASMTNIEVNNFLITQLQPLRIDLITFALLAFYWVDRVKQFSYYKKSNEIHLFLSILYLMFVFIVPYSNTLTMYFPENTMVKVWFSLNIFFIGIFSFLNWVYATHKYQLVDKSLDHHTITKIKITASIEPIVALLTIVVALINQSLWDISWLLTVILYIIADRFIKKSVVDKSIDNSERDREVKVIN